MSVREIKEKIMQPAADNAVEIKKQKSDFFLAREKLTRLPTETKNGFIKLLPRNRNVDQFIFSFLNATRKGFVGCSFESLFRSMAKCIELDLMPGGARNMVWLIPDRQGNIQTWIGYQGCIELARRAGITIYADTIYSNEKYSIKGGTNPSIEHDKKIIDRGTVIATYCVAKFSNGEKIFTVMTLEELEKFAKNKSGAWSTYKSEMQIKTVIKRLYKQLPADVMTNVDESMLKDDDNDVVLNSDKSVYNHIANHNNNAIDATSDLNETILTEGEHSDQNNYYIEE